MSTGPSDESKVLDLDPPLEMRYALVVSSEGLTEFPRTVENDLAVGWKNTVRCRITPPAIPSRNLLREGVPKVMSFRGIHRTLYFSSVFAQYSI